MNVGFYYMANAVGRLAGTVLSGLLYQWNGLSACLWVSAGFVVAAGLLSLMLPTTAPERDARHRGAAGGAGLIAGVTAPLPRRLLAEFLGSAFLAVAVVGSGIAAQQLSPGNTGLAAPRDRAGDRGRVVRVHPHVRPSLRRPLQPGRLAGRRQLRRASAGATRSPTYPPRCPAASPAPSLANGMFALAAISISDKHRASEAHLSRGGRRDARAAARDLLAGPDAARLDRARRPSAPTSGLRTSSPARRASPTRRSPSAGCSPTPSPGSRRPPCRRSLCAQLAGGLVAVGVIRVLYPDITPEEAAEALVPHDGLDAGVVEP